MRKGYSRTRCSLAENNEWSPHRVRTTLSLDGKTLYTHCALCGTKREERVQPERKEG